MGIGIEYSMNMKQNSWSLCIILLCLLVLCILWYIVELKLFPLHREGYHNGNNSHDVIFDKDILISEWTIESKIPNIIWTFWDGDIPPFVQRCIQSWKDYNPNYKMVVLDKKNLSNFLPELDLCGIKGANDMIQRLADYTRIHILSKYGGFWFDTSIICQAPNTWIHDIQNKTSVEFIGYYNDEKTSAYYKTSIPVIENWCFACVPGCMFAQNWRDEFMKMLDYSNPNEYVTVLFNSGLPPQNNDRYDYLTMHLSGQKVLYDNLRKGNTNQYMNSMYLIKAEDTAFIHYTDNGKLEWDTNKTFNKILHKQHADQPILKLIGITRDDIIDRCAKQNIDIETLFT